MPYRSPGPGDERVDWILREINTAQQTLDARIAEAQSLPETEPSKAARIARLNQMKREVDNVYGNLDSNVKVWADRDITNFYRRGHSTASAQLSTGYSFTLPHREAVELMSFDAYDDVGTRLQQVRDGFSANVELQKAFESLDPTQLAQLRAESRSAINQMLLTGEDPRKIAKRMADGLWENGVPIIDAAGRQWNPEAYTRMLVRTKSANAYNAGSMNKYAEEGVKRVQVFDGVEDDQECADANGQIWTLDYAMEHIIAHPNCRRAFGPLQGDGPVDNKNIVDKLVKFDRLELAAQSLVALRAFRRTGEINVSSTLARLVIEIGESVIGFPIPVLDSFIMNVAGQGFRNLDAAVESYIDPVLFAAGLIKEIPNRAQVAAIQTSNPLRTFVDDLAESVSAARFDERGQVSPFGQIVTKLEQISDQADAIVETLEVSGRGALPYIPYVSDQMDAVGRFGQIVGETLVVLHRGDIDGLKSAWDEAVDYIDNMRALREAHQDLLLAAHDEAVMEMSFYIEARTRIRSLLQQEEIPSEIPEDLMRYLDEFTQARGLELPTTRAHLEQLDEQLEQLHWSAFKRVSETRKLARARDQRVLPFPASIGPDYASEAGTYWDLDEFGDGFAEFLEALNRAYVPSTGANLDLMFDGGEALSALARIPKAVDRVFENIAGDLPPEQFARFLHYEASQSGNTGLLDLLIDSGALDRTDTSYIHKANFIATLGEELQLVTFDPVRGIINYGRRPIADEDIITLLDIAALSSKAFDGQVRQLFPMTLQTLIVRVSDPRYTVSDVWSNFTKSLRFESFKATRLTNANLGKLLEGEFPGGVVTLGSPADIGVNGANYIVDMPGGQRLFVKTFEAANFGMHDGGLQGAPKSPISQVLASLVAREIGDVEAPPTFLWSVADGSVWGVVNPALTDAKPFSLSRTMRVDQARKHSFLDLVSGEADGHGGNYMKDQYNETLLHIDMEGGFFEENTGWLERSSSVASYFTELKDAWFAGDDITVGGLDPAVRLIALTDDEVEAIVPALTSGHRNVFVSTSELPVLANDQGERFLVTGRVGRFDFTRRRAADGVPLTAEAHDWQPAYFLTESELDFVLMSTEDRTALFVDEITEQLIELPESLVAEWAGRMGIFGGDVDDLAEHMAGRAVRIMERRLDRMINEGAVNITGGVSEYVNTNGLRAVVGEQIEWIDEAGESQFGTVVNIIERRDGSMHAQIANRIGFGLDKSELAGIPRVVDVDLSDARIMPADQELDTDYLNTILRKIRESDREAQDLFTHTFDDVTQSTVFELDDTGIFRAARQQHLQIDNFADSGVALFVRGGRNGNLLTRADLPPEIAQRLGEIVNEELPRVSGAGKPLRVIISAAPLQMDDGKRAFGVFLADERILHVSATGLFKGVEVNEIGRVVFDNRDDMIKLANFDDFRQVLRHELSHSKVVGLELEWRSEMSSRVLKQVIDSNPSLRTFDDFEAFAVEQLARAGADFNINAPALQQLVQHRVSVIEDIVHSNRISAAKRLVEHENFPPDLLSPTLIRRIKSGDEDAYHELWAEVFAQNVKRPDGTVGPFPSLSAWAFRNKIHPSYVRDFDQPTRSLPPQYQGAGFLDWAKLNLRDDAALIPLQRENRKFWKDVGLDTDTLVEQARVPYGGFTYDVVTETYPDTGWAVAIAKNELRIKNFSKLSDAEVAALLEQYRITHAGTLESPDWFLGGWHDADIDELVLDTTRVFPDEASAAHFGFKENQKEMFDLGSLRAPVGEEPDLVFKKLVTKYETFEDYIEEEIPDYLKLKSEVIDVLKSSNKSRSTIEVDELGRYPTLSASSIAKKARREKWEADYAEKKVVVADVIPGKGKKKEKLIPTDEVIDTSKGAIKRRLRDVLVRAAEEYSKDPDLRETMRFYRTWNRGYRELAAETGVDFTRIAGGAAAMSPGLDAEENYRAALWVTRAIADDNPLTERQVRIIREYYADLAFRYRGEYAKSKKTRSGRLKSIARGDEFESWIPTLNVGDRVSEKTAEEGQKILHVIRKMENAEEALKHENNADIDSWDSWAELFKIKVNPGLAGMNTDSYVKGIMIIRGEIEVIDGLGDVKVRSFYNNIVDPLNLIGIGDVTVDFHMMDAALRANTNQAARVKSIADRPGMDGIAMGMRVIIADAVRELHEDGWDFLVDAESPAELQEVIWGTWKRGKEQGWWGELRTPTEIP